MAVTARHLLNELHIDKKHPEKKYCTLFEQRFCSVSIPNISMKDYITRLFQYVKPCPTLEAVIVCLIFLERSHAQLSCWNSHRFFAVALLLALKYLEDGPISLMHYSHIAGVSPQELTELELEFLKHLKFKLYVSRTEFYHRLNQFIKNLKSPDGTQRANTIQVSSPQHGRTGRNQTSTRVGMEHQTQAHSQSRTTTHCT